MDPPRNNKKDIKSPQQEHTKNIKQEGGFHAKTESGSGTLKFGKKNFLQENIDIEAGVAVSDNVGRSENVDVESGHGHHVENVPDESGNQKSNLEKKIYQDQDHDGSDGRDIVQATKDFSDIQTLKDSSADINQDARNSTALRRQIFAKPSASDVVSPVSEMPASLPKANTIESPAYLDSNARAAQAFLRKREFASTKQHRPSVYQNNAPTHQVPQSATQPIPQSIEEQLILHLQNNHGFTSDQIAELSKSLPQIATNFGPSRRLSESSKPSSPYKLSHAISTPEMAKSGQVAAENTLESLESLENEFERGRYTTNHSVLGAEFTADPAESIHPPNSYQSQGGLDLESVISYFEGTREKRKMSKSFHVPLPYPRFTFYSEKTGVVRANTWSQFDISHSANLMDMQTPLPNVRDILTCSPFWIDISSPTQAEMASISKVFGLHPLTNEDIQTPDTREKCEVFQKYYFVVIRSFEQDQFKSNFLQPITVYIVIFEECILSFQSTMNPHSRNVRSRIDQLSSYGDVSITTEWINYALIDDITDSFIPLMKVVELEVDSIEELVLIPVLKSDYVDMDMLRRIGMVRKRVMQLLRLVSTKADVIKTIITRYMNQQEPAAYTNGVFETRFYLEDIHDHISTMMQNLNHYEKSLARSHSNYLAQISIDITQASNRTSDTVMRMTTLASILVPLNIITGLFGMNVNVPGQGVNNLSWFYGIIAFMICLTTSTFFVLRRHELV